MWHFHYVTELNYIENHLNKGDTITQLICDADQNCCESNHNRLLSHCARCIGIRQHGLSSLSKSIQNLPLIHNDFKMSWPDNGKFKFKSLTELKNLNIDGFDIGYATYSSLVDRFLDTDPDITKCESIVNKLLADSYRIFRTAMKYLKENHYDLVYIFNGRYAAARPWVRACEIQKVQFVTHERTSSLDRAIRFSNTLPHYPGQYTERVLQFWEDAHKDEDILKEAEDYFEERPKGKMTGWVSFTDKQKENNLPQDWDGNLRNVVIFATTEREFVGIQDMTHGFLFSSQVDAFPFIIKTALAKDPNLYFTLRIHPNSIKEKVRWWEGEAFQGLPRCRIIQPESSISSYALLFACEKALCFRSSMGIEATYWGKPSIVLAPPFYGKIDAVYEPSTIDEAIGLVVARLDPKPKINALKYAAFMRCAGDKLPFSKSINYYTIDFKGKVLEARREVHEWLGACEKRPEITGIKKWFRDRYDRLEFNKLWKKCDGYFADR